MKCGGFIWGAIMVCVVVVLALPASRSVIMSTTAAHPYYMGIIKFAILASMGELLAIRITAGQWNIPCGMLYRSCYYGCLGFAMAAIVPLCANGVSDCIQNGILYGARFHSPIIRAFWTSLVMNLSFAPVVMSAHRISDTYIDLAGGRLRNLPSVKIDTVLATINWHSLVVVVLMKTVVFFWIPAHTITFLLPPEYRVLFAAILSFVLGVLLAFFKHHQAKPPMDTLKPETVLVS